MVLSYGMSLKFLVCNLRLTQLQFCLSPCMSVQFALSHEGKKLRNKRQIQTRQKEANIESKAVKNESAKVQSVAACAEVPRSCSKYHISLKTCHSTQFHSKHKLQLIAVQPDAIYGLLIFHNCARYAVLLLLLWASSLHANDDRYKRQ